MVLTHSLGFPRIGRKRELKFAQEAFWSGKSRADELLTQGQILKHENWQHQALCDFVPVGDFSFYDHVLDTSFLLGNIPERAKLLDGSELDAYFRVARGRSANDTACQCTRAGEMTKWFNTNYHYIVPEVSADTVFQLNSQHIVASLLSAQQSSESIQIQAQAEPHTSKVKPVLLGPVTYLWLSKAKDGSNPLDLLDTLLPIYRALLDELASHGVEWVQIDEPILVTELSAEWRYALEKAYHVLKVAKVNILVASYFGKLQENLQLACNLPVAGLHVDALSLGDEVIQVVDWLPVHKTLSLGVIDGRNIWKTDLTKILDWIEPIAQRLKDRLWLAPTCSLLHVPVDLETETHADTKQGLDPEIKNWLAFAIQKLDELQLLKLALNNGRDSVKAGLAENSAAILSRKNSQRVHDPVVKSLVDGVTKSLGRRTSNYTDRIMKQQQRLNLPLYPTTTIGSFPQTSEIRQARLQFKKGELSATEYQHKMEQEIQFCVRAQEELDLDVFVHGEAERNDMVEYFGEQLTGYVFSRFGWVQSYGSRCVKPPIIFGDISRPKAMTVAWTQYAQSLTLKPMKGMLTGPVTMLNWSFVRDDQSRQQTCTQLALALREEVLDLEKAGTAIIQIDEAALREGLPLRKSEWHEYLNWAVESFRICANGVRNETQIHTHMCYSEFNDIIEAIAFMDADVITIETSRSDMALLDVFDEFDYPNDIGPGVYDIHSPNIPNQTDIVELMEKAAQRIPAERLWINPDCGLKTRRWEEVTPALQSMVKAAQVLRDKASRKTEELSALNA